MSCDATVEREPDERVCWRCGEFRLTEVVITAGQRVGFCPVCAHDWKLEPKG